MIFPPLSFILCFTPRPPSFFSPALIRFCGHAPLGFSRPPQNLISIHPRCLPGVTYSQPHNVTNVTTSQPHNSIHLRCPSRVTCSQLHNPRVSRIDAHGARRTRRNS